jgi:hypothetical protein
MSVLFLRRASPEAIPGASWPAGILQYLPAAITLLVETLMVTMASVLGQRGPLLIRTGAQAVLPARIRYSVSADRRFGSFFPSFSESAPDGKLVYAPPSTSRVVLPLVISEFGSTLRQ